MIGKIVLATSLVAALSMPAFAATEYWVAKDAATKKCEVVMKKPDGVKQMEIGKASHKTMADAEKAMKADAACK